MPIQGLRDTSNFVTNQAPENWREGLLLLYPNSADAAKAPLLALTSLMKTRVTDDPRFHWWEKELDDRRVALGADVADATAGTVTTVTLGAGALGLKEGDILKSEETSEQFRVYADPSGDTSVQLVRGWAGTTTEAINYDGAGVNPNLLVIGSAYEEGSLAPTGVNYDPNEKYNYCQIFRNTLEMTRTASKTRLRTGDAVKEAKRECLEYLGIDVERALWHGVRSSTTHKGKPLRTMNGVIAQIPSDNVKTATSGAADMETLEEWLRLAFLFGSSEKLGFCGNRFLMAVNQIVRKNSHWNIQSGIKEFGMAVVRLTCPFGDLVLKSHPLFNQVTSGTTAATAYYGQDSWCAILDASNLQYVHLTDSDIKYQPDLQENGMDGMKSGYLGELSMELHHPKTHFLIKGLVSGNADS